MKIKLENQFPTNLIQNYFISIISNEEIELLLNKKKLVIIHGHQGVGKSTHAQHYCSYISKKGKITRWIDASSEKSVSESMRKITEEITNKSSDGFDNICSYLIRVCSDESVHFVFDNLENFEILKIFIAKFEDMNNITILVTTKDNSFKDKLSKHKFIDLKIDFFNFNQAKEFFEKSLNNEKYIQNKDLLVNRLLKSEECFGFLPGSLNSIKNFINNTDFDIQELLDMPIFGINPFYFRYFDKIENKNSMKVLYYMSFMNADRIPSLLIHDLFKNDLDFQSLQEAIDVLIQNGFIESIKSDKFKYFRIHRLTQATTKAFRRMKSKDYEIENKLLNSYNEFFVADIDFVLFTINEEARQLISHLQRLIEDLDIEIYIDRIKYFELKLNFAIYLFEEDCDNREDKIVIYKAILEECYRELGRVDGYSKVKVCHALGFYYWKIEFK